MKPKIFIALQVVIDQGGISASIQNLLHEIHEKYDVTLCAVGGYISPHAEIPSDVRIIDGSPLIRDAITDRKLLKNQNFIQRLYRNGIRLLRRYVGMPFIVRWGVRQIAVPNMEYDAAVAFSNDIYDCEQLSVGGVYDLVLSIPAKRKVAWMHNDLRKEGYTRKIALQAFRNFDAIVTVSFENKSLIDEMVPEYREKTYVGYNTYNIERIKELSLADNPYTQNGKLHFVTVARLQITQKRQDRIIKACGKLKEEGFTNFEWYLVGEGELETLKEMAEKLNVQDIVHFTGIKNNPYPYMRYADAFVLTSQYEGLGMTVKEAQIVGCPTFITEFGPAHEAVIDGKQGKICENSTEGVYEMVKELIQHPAQLDSYRQYIKENPVSNDLALQQFCEACNLCKEDQR